MHFNMFLSDWLSVCASVCLSVHLSVCLSYVFVTFLNARMSSKSSCRGFDTLLMNRNPAFAYFHTWVLGIHQCSRERSRSEIHSGITIMIIQVIKRYDHYLTYPYHKKTYKDLLHYLIMKPFKGPYYLSMISPVHSTDATFGGPWLAMSSLCGLDLQWWGQGRLESPSSKSYCSHNVTSTAALLLCLWLYPACLKIAVSFTNPGDACKSWSTGNWKSPNHRTTHRLGWGKKVLWCWWSWNRSPEFVLTVPGTENKRQTNANHYYMRTRETQACATCYL